jgi:hypothetical protein
MINCFSKGGKLFHGEKYTKTFYYSINKEIVMFLYEMQKIFTTFPILQIFFAFYQYIKWQ